MSQLGIAVNNENDLKVDYPKRLIKRGETDIAIVKKIQKRLNDLGCGPLIIDGIFGLATEKAVKTFQLRFFDQDGIPLKVDGLIGTLTWLQLFGPPTIKPGTDSDVSHPLLLEALKIAKNEIDVMEEPLGSNRGPRVDEYIRSAGLNPEKGSFPWCAAFIYWCFNKAANSISIPNPVIKTAGVLDHWNKAGKKKFRRINSEDAKNDPSLIKPGHIFIISYGSGLGHTGLVKDVIGGKLITIEGNTNKGGAREGIGVFEHDKRSIFNINRGFIDYGV